MFMTSSPRLSLILTSELYQATDSLFLLVVMFTTLMGNALTSISIL
jgi:hypothetical protein